MKVYIALSHDCCGEPFCGLFETMDAAKPHADTAIEEWDTETFKRTRRWSSWGWKEGTGYPDGVRVEWPEEKV